MPGFPASTVARRATTSPLASNWRGPTLEPYTDAQYTALAGLTRLLRAAFPGITPERIQGHCDIAPERKTDPGEAFDWSRYRAGLTDSKEET